VPGPWPKTKADISDLMSESMPKGLLHALRYSVKQIQAQFASCVAVILAASVLLNTGIHHRLLRSASTDRQPVSI